MNCIEAIRYYIEPYQVSDGKLEILLNEQGLQTDDEYNAGKDKTAMYKAIIAALKSLTTLKKEKDNGSEQDYDVDKLEELIKQYEEEIGIKASKSKTRDITAWW